MAGALRFNKGLAVLAELVERWSRRGAEIPLLLQASTKHANRHGSREAPLLRRIEAAAYRPLREQSGSLDRDRYLANFRGAITLAAYEPATFAGQVSGVAIDALMSGSPIVASEGTEPARLVEEFGAGVVVPFGDAEALDHAIEAMLRDRHRFFAEARAAGEILARRHDPSRLARMLDQ
jgi:glycosyltransferase involved in cell wall biosynthesis